MIEVVELELRVRDGEKDDAAVMCWTAKLTVPASGYDDLEWGEVINLLSSILLRGVLTEV